MWGCPGTFLSRGGHGTPPSVPPPRSLGKGDSWQLGSEAPLCAPPQHLLTFWRLVGFSCVLSIILIATLRKYNAENQWGSQGPGFSWAAPSVAPWSGGGGNGPPIQFNSRGKSTGTPHTRQELIRAVRAVPGAGPFSGSVGSLSSLRLLCSGMPPPPLPPLRIQPGCSAECRRRRRGGQTVAESLLLQMALCPFPFLV